jgi:hypothetical protein
MAFNGVVAGHIGKYEHCFGAVFGVRNGKSGGMYLLPI